MATNTIANKLREAAARLRGESADTTPGPWRRHDTHLNTGGHTATVLTERQELNGVELVAWLPSWSHEPWADRPCWSNSRWIALVHPGLAEPLAVWLEEYARWATDSIEEGEEGGSPVHESEYCDGEIGKNCRCFDRVLAVARVLNGTPQTEATP
jgi:hypothetical protein